MITLKNLVVGITNQLQVIVYKSFVYRNSNGCNLDLGFQVCENDMQSFKLFGIFCKNENIVFSGFIVLQVFYQQVELPVKRRLFLCRKLTIDN